MEEKETSRRVISCSTCPLAFRLLSIQLSFPCALCPHLTSSFSHRHGRLRRRSVTVPHPLFSSPSQPFLKLTRHLAPSLTSDEGKSPAAVPSVSVSVSLFRPTFLSRQLHPALAASRSQLTSSPCFSPRPFFLPNTTLDFLSALQSRPSSSTSVPTRRESDTQAKIPQSASSPLLTDTRTWMLRMGLAAKFASTLWARMELAFGGMAWRSERS